MYHPATPTGLDSTNATEYESVLLIVTLSVLYSHDDKIEHYHIKYKDNEYTIDYEETFESLTQMVEYYQNDSDGLVTRLKVPVEKSGKVEYSVDSEDFKKSKSGGFEEG